jgi:hypothetical protein
MQVIQSTFGLNIAVLIRKLGLVGIWAILTKLLAQFKQIYFLFQLFLLTCLCLPAVFLAGRRQTGQTFLSKRKVWLQKFPHCRLKECRRELKIANLEHAPKVSSFSKNVSCESKQCVWQWSFPLPPVFFTRKRQESLRRKERPRKSCEDELPTLEQFTK